jgi:hypothetical protein
VGEKGFHKFATESRRDGARTLFMQEPIAPEGKIENDEHSVMKQLLVSFFVCNRNFSRFPGFSSKKGFRPTNMANPRKLPLCVLVSALLCSTALTAQQFAPKVRIVDRIDETNLVTLKGNTHPSANAKNDAGRVSPDLPMTDLILVLSRDPAQQAAFDKFVAGQYDPNSPNYHQWLTPEQVGANFGPSQTDIATVTNWLTGHGFSVTQVTNDRLSIRFSGTASQVESTFHTEIHNLVVKGEAHIGNMSDPQIPAALAPVVVGIKSLHNFFPRPLHHVGSLVTKDSKTGQWARITGTAPAASSLGAAAASSTAGSTAPRTLLGAAATGSAVGGGVKTAFAARPQFGISGTSNGSPYLVEDIGPYDFATIYNVIPLWNAGIDGTGQTIAIAGTSSIVLNDVATFRNFFMPNYTSTPAPILISGNSSPLTVCTSTTGASPYPTAPCTLDDLLENSLDVEWSGAIAPKAQIVLVASYPNSATDDNLFDSESYIVNNLTARIMNVSYGECELGVGTAGNVQYYNLWQSAAAEGIAVFVASGDSGAASCDAGGDAQYGVPYLAEYGLSVSGLASTPYNTAVGGTDFNWCPLPSSNNSPECTAAPYWSSTNTSNYSALGYVPEVPWNDTCASPVVLPYMKYFFSQVLTVSDAETGCNAFVVYANELQQQGFGSLLYLVDTVGGSGGASGCVVNDGSTVASCAASTTSTGSTYGSIRLVNDGWPKPSWQTGVAGIPTDQVRDLPDVSFFASDGFLSSSAYLICVSNATVDSQCSYSSSSEPVAEEVGGTSVATPAMAGVMALINQKTGAAQGSPNAELYKLAAKQTYSSCSAESVTAGSASCYFNDIDTGTNAMACDYSASVTTPSPNCNRIHSTDYVGILTGYSAGTGYDLATGLGSLNVANVVNAWPAVQGATATTVTVKPGQSSINSNNSLSVTVTVASTASGGVTPTGTVTLTATGSTYTSSQSLSSAGSATFNIPANSLGAGVDTLTGTYSGDILYAANKGTSTVTVTTVALLTPTVTVTPASKTLNSSASLGVTATVTGNGVIPITGTATLTAGSYNSGPQTLANGSYQFMIPANAFTSAGSDPINVAYSGDSNYAASPTNSTNVTVTLSTFSLTQTQITYNPSTANSSGIAPGATATATVTVSAVAGYTGTVTLSCAQTSTTASGGDGASCTGGGTLNTVTLTGATTSGTVTFTVGTYAKVGELVYPNVRGKGRGQGRGWMGAGGGAVLAFLVFLGIPARRRSWRQMLGVLVLIAALGALSSCGGGGGGGGGGSAPSDPGTTAGTYTFTVQGTGTPTASAAPTTFTIVVN